LPYKSPDAAFMAFIQHMEESGKALGGEASVPLNEGTSNMPVGTMLAQIEQTLKPIKGVFKGLHRSQAEEFQLLKQRFREDPSALWRFNKKPARQWEEAEFLAALDNTDLVPMADPNTMSQVQRIAIAMAMVELAEKAPYLFHERDTALRFMRMIGIPDPEGIMATADEVQQAKAAMSPPPPAPAGKPPNPVLDQAKADQAEADAGLKKAQTAATMAGLQIQGQESAAAQAQAQGEREFKATEILTDAQERDADRQAELTKTQINQHAVALKTGAELVKAAAKGHADEAAAQHSNAHEVGLGAADAAHEHVQNALQHAHEQQMAAGFGAMNAEPAEET